jgi:hypothetical protein
MDEILIVTFFGDRESALTKFYIKKNQVRNNITCEVIDPKVLI